MQFCSEPGCGARVLYGRCQAHASPARVVRQQADGAIVHAWYCSLRWRLLRASVIREQPFCMVCDSQGRRVVTQEIDHVRKHDGDPALFWDRANLQGLCKPCHTRKTKRGE
jgi:5-methylcytosine-specific restriction enzyme A